MFQLISVIVIIVGILLILIVLVQNSKGGGLAANFSAANQVMGARRSADFLEKATWTLASVLLFLSIVSNIVIGRTKNDANESKIKENIDNVISSDRPLELPTNVPNPGSQPEEQ